MSGFAILRNKNTNNEKIHTNDQNQQEEQPKLTLGAKLKNARINKGLSIKDVANLLHFKTSIIQSFENDIFALPNLPVVFTQGYLKRYLQFLELPEDLLQESFCSGVEVSILDTIPTKTNAKSRCGWIKVMTAFVLLFAFGMTLLWWWQNYQKEQEEREALVNSTANSMIFKAEDTQNAPQQILSQELKENDNKIISNLQPTPHKINDVTTSVTTENIKKLELKETADNIESQPLNLENNQSETIPEAPTMIDTTKLFESNSNSINNVEETKIEEEKAKTQAVESKNNLRIEVISASSWITVRGDNQQTLTSKLYKSGDKLTFNDHHNYQLIIGAPMNVKVYYQEEEVPLKLDGQVSRISLPLE
ncbi:RodZ domain-containing protein [Pasteurella atlantica]|uniref:RodZ domain-containing protein n=1 Tax=Pasteurellaceae TaxID=712 RepID=UPI00276FA0BF|nr:RodZ domain-containing protein [Pasteurella atlantica]MDP8099010.1 DUF4115 domain-containing protein [Pasteurella atlantica]MDP8107037.1 DUF4115 domain-containing protein [Pasteurella atlantica]MDP8116727.1 DUF4115 domain-containing protein [Pasteurella atlantica]